MFSAANTALVNNFVRPASCKSVRAAHALRARARCDQPYLHALLLMFSLPSVLLLSPRLHSPPRTGRIASIAPAARFEAFDWLDHWQPIAWARDVPLDKPTKITLFDVDYAVTRRSDREPLALLDRCPAPRCRVE